MKNSKINAEEQDSNKIRKISSETKACGRKWLTTICLSSGRHVCAHYIMVSMSEQLEVQVAGYFPV